MNQVYIKYNNLLKFILTIDDKNEWITWLQTVPFEAFHLTLKDKLSKNLTQDQIYDEILTTAKIENDKIDETQKKTLKRYIEYFCSIAKLF